MLCCRLKILDALLWIDPAMLDSVRGLRTECKVTLSIKGGGTYEAELCCGNFVPISVALSRFFIDKVFLQSAILRSTLLGDVLAL